MKQAAHAAARRSPLSFTLVTRDPVFGRYQVPVIVA
jgi:hypothetical protein